MQTIRNGIVVTHHSQTRMWSAFTYNPYGPVGYSQKHHRHSVSHLEDIYMNIMDVAENYRNKHLHPETELGAVSQIGEGVYVVATHL